MTYDAIVAGVGGMGSATVFELARRGLKVLGLEQFDIPHTFGSSHGHSRIIRLAYAEHPGYVPLLRRAYTRWRALEDLTGERLLVITGGIDAGAEDSATVQGSLASCALHGLPHERLDAAALRRRFPGYRLPDTMIGVYQPDAGMLDPERCVVAHVDAARKLGAEIRTRERVKSWRTGDDGVRVETDKDAYRARRLIVTAGPWARGLVPALVELAVPERQVVLWTEPRVPLHFSASTFPVFNMAAPEGRYYGYPAHDGHGFKIGRYHHRAERVDDPDRMDRACHAEDEAVLRAALRRYFPDADGPTLAMQACLFTNSPDEHFILDLLPDAPQVAIAAGFSGHGFKFCSVVGEIMADLALAGGTRHDVSMFRLDRFAEVRRNTRST